MQSSAPRMITQFPQSTGLRPRPADDYDRLCRKFYVLSRAGLVSKAAAAARELCARFGDAVADDAWTHGRTIADCA